MKNASDVESLLYRLAPVIIPVAFFVFWEIAVRLGGFTNILLPPPSKVLETLFELIRTGTLFNHIGASLMRASSDQRPAQFGGSRAPLWLTAGTSERARIQ